jgi:uncharacterized protein (TIGR03000 family)
MRSTSIFLVLAVTPLLIGVTPSESVAQRGRPMMMSRFQPGMQVFRPVMVNPNFLRMRYSPTYQQMPNSGYGMSGMSYGGSGGAQSSYGGPSGSRSSYGGYGGSQSPYGGSSGSQSPYGESYLTSSTSDASSQASTAPKAPISGDVEASAPLTMPPAHRAIVRIRLPHTVADVGFDGQKVDSMGRMRTYLTPDLSRPRTFEVTATWKHDGRTVWLVERVTVKAGQVRIIDFTSGN